MGRPRKEDEKQGNLSKAIRLKPLVECGGLTIQEAAQLCGCSSYMFKKLVDSCKSKEASKE